MNIIDLINKDIFYNIKDTVADKNYLKLSTIARLRNCAYKISTNDYYSNQEICFVLSETTINNFTERTKELDDFEIIIFFGEKLKNTFTLRKLDKIYFYIYRENKPSEYILSYDNLGLKITSISIF